MISSSSSVIEFVTIFTYIFTYETCVTGLDLETVTRVTGDWRYQERYQVGLSSWLYSHIGYRWSRVSPAGLNSWLCSYMYSQMKPVLQVSISRQSHRLQLISREIPSGIEFVTIFTHRLQVISSRSSGIEFVPMFTYIFTHVTCVKNLSRYHR